MNIVTTTEARLNSLRAEVGEGGIIAITSHGRPVAVLSQPEPTRGLDQFAGQIRVPGDVDAP